MTSSYENKPENRALKPRELVFCREYTSNGFNASKAAKKAGYKSYYASAANQLLKRTRIKRYISSMMGRMAKRADISKEEVMEHIAACVKADRTQIVDKKGHLVNLHDLPDDLKKLIDGVEFAPVFNKKGEYQGQSIRKIKLVAKASALELSTKVLGMNAPEKRETTVKASFDLNIIQRPDLAREEREAIENAIDVDVIEEE